MQKKQGISLIVLVITIIVMIILVASVVITLSNTGVIDRAGQAVDLTNQSQVQDLAALIWADAYMDDLRGEDLVEEVTTKLSEQGIKEEDWNITVTDTGVIIKEKYKGPTLGSLIKGPEDYGKTVDYTVTAEVPMYSYDWSTEETTETKKTVTVTDWQIYYHNEDYVYLVAKESIGWSTLNKGTTVASLTADELALYEKFRVGNGPKYTLVDPHENSQAVAQLIKDYAVFANTAVYGSNVVGAIGGPTLELLVAGWNAKGYTPTLTLTTDVYGYKINNENSINVTVDGLYINNYDHRLTSPAADGDLMISNTGTIHSVDVRHDPQIRPIVCLKSSTPATVGTTTDFSLVK